MYIQQRNNQTYHVRKALNGKTPAVETRAETDGTTLRVDLNLTEEIILVGRDDDVDGLDGAREGLVALLEIHLEL